jgi:hypothetical protein
MHAAKKQLKQNNIVAKFKLPQQNKKLFNYRKRLFYTALTRELTYVDNFLLWLQNFIKIKDMCSFYFSTKHIIFLESLDARLHEIDLELKK